MLSTNALRDLLIGRPGWRLEQRSTPGADPLWCFVAGGKIEFSVAVDDGGAAVRLYSMETDRELVFDSADALVAWLRANRPDAVLEPVPTGEKPSKKARLRRFTDWS